MSSTDQEARVGRNIYTHGHGGAPLPPLQQMPPEMFQAVLSNVQSPRDLVALDMALGRTNMIRNCPIDWISLARTHQRNLLENPNLCKNIQYGDNDRLKWDDMRIYPAPWTRIPRTRTYLQMLRFDSMRPQRNLDNEPITSEDIRHYYNLEQIQKRESFVFETRVAREGGGRPSLESQKKLKLKIEDRRNYSQLLEDAETDERKEAIKERRNRDDIPHQKDSGQYEAFRKFFYQVVRRNNLLHMRVCMNCLAKDAVVLSVPETKEHGRFCSDCLLDFADLRDIPIIGI